MSAESPRHARMGGPLTVPSQPPSDRSIIDAVSGFINDVTLSSSSAVDPKDVIQWARFETADINEPTPEGDSDTDISPLLLILGYGSGVQVWLIPPTGEAQEVLSWRQGTVRVLRILPTPQHGDCFASKRPLIALCDSASPGPTFCSLSFISIRGGEQVKSIKFKNPILDVLANKRSVVVSFSERFAVFDASTLEDRLAVTTCYPCPCPLGGSAPVNPLALGDRWLAYADKKLNQSKRSSGGCEGEGVTSYTASVLHAAKSLSKGLLGLGESVAHSLAGGRGASQSPSPPNADLPQPGVLTVIDIENNDEEDGQDHEEPYDPIVAHFVAHSEAIIALKFDASGMLLVTADRRGHDFHVFRINPHPCGPSLASVHHLYVLHRGDTTAKVQDIAISPDSRWTAVSTLRGTTHVFAISPYGGAAGVRTHTAPRVVNRLSRFHRSAGLPIHAAHAVTHASSSPVSEGLAQGAWFPNPRLPPYPLPTTVAPLAQLRPTANLPTHTITRTSAGRQRLSSLSEECNTAPLLARARWGAAPAPARAPAAAALYLVAASGCLSHLALHPRVARNVPKEKICDESPIELEVEPIAQWPLQRPSAAADLLAPLPPSNPLLQPLSCRRCADMCMSEEERWLSQVEIVTHFGPHRRLWMGPQFVFKTYNCTGSNSSLSEAETVEVDASAARGVARSNPVNMPGVRAAVPVLIDSGSASSLEHSPSDSFRRKSLLAESGRAASVCDVQLKEDLAEAMKEDQGWRGCGATARSAWGAGGAAGAAGGSVARAVDPQGTVVAPPAARPAPALDPDAYTRANSDEATFRPVVRAPHALPLQPDMVVRPLPRSTTIPVQTAPPRDLTPHDEPLPLTTAVVIPAALTRSAWPDAPPDYECDLVFHDPAVLLDPSSERDTITGKPDSVVEVDEPAERKSSDVKDDGRSPRRRTVTVESADPLEQGLAAAEDDKYIDVVTETETSRRPDDANIKTEEIKESEFAKLDEPKTTATRMNASFGEKAAAPESLNPKEIPSMKKPSETTVKPDKPGKQKVLIVDEAPPLKTTEPDKVDRVNIDVKKTDVNKDLKRQESDGRKRDSAYVRGSAECAERESDYSKSLPKSNWPSDDIQPTARIRIKKSPTPKSVSDRDSEVSVKDNKSKKIYEPKDVIESKEFKDKEVKEPKEIKKQKDVRESKNTKQVKVSEEIQNRKGLRDTVKVEEVKKEHVSVVKEEPAVIAMKLPAKDVTETNSKKHNVDEVKTEDQAWDMLMTESEKPIALSNQQSVISDTNAEEKPKTKRNKKIKKTQDEPQQKSEDDSFVEIHAIEEKHLPCSGDLVSISTPFEDEPSNTYLAKLKKPRSPKSLTPEKKDDFERNSFDYHSREVLKPPSWPKITNKYDEISDIEVFSDFGSFQKHSEDLSCSTAQTIRKHTDGTSSETTSFFKDTPKQIKSKSLSPYPEWRNVEKPVEIEKDVYVINTTEDDFPEIQITRAPKPRKRSPQIVERRSIEKDVIEKPAKSWSSIAAARNPVKKLDDDQNIPEALDKKVDKFKTEDIGSNLGALSSTTVSLQEKLMELCKRTDIMVAECDAPSELNFVEEHHAVLQDLPPLEPLDFGLDDFKLEVMRDSLLDVNDGKLTSPICKINIDDILSSIKETTHRVIESSTFNLIDLERVPTRKERGFSVIGTHKITSQEVKLDVDTKSDDKEVEIMEKSSDEDAASPVASTDSDKDDKKNAGASNSILLPSKQSAKSKKSRRKKK